MKLFTAMVLSSKSQAEMYIHQRVGVIVASKKRYRLIATYLPKEKAEDTFDLSIYHVTYPHAQQGQGQGDPVISDTPHRNYPYTGLDALHTYLEKLGIDYEDGWTPVENEEKE